MKFDFNAGIIGQNRRGSTEDSCGGVWHINRHYERQIEGNWDNRPFDPLAQGYSGPLGMSSVLLTVTGQTSLNTWQQSTVDISTYALATVRIVWLHARGGTSFTADMQIDDITIDGTTYTFESGTENFQTTRTTNYQTIASYPTATFYTINTTTSGASWNRDAAGTPSGSTGSTIDHTLGTTSGYYLYTETSGSGQPFEFILRSPSITLSDDPGNLTFWTSRYGASMGELDVHVFVEALP